MHKSILGIITCGDGEALLGVSYYKPRCILAILWGGLLFGWKSGFSDKLKCRQKDGFIAQRWALKDFVKILIEKHDMQGGRCPS